MDSFATPLLRPNAVAPNIISKVAAILTSGKGVLAGSCATLIAILLLSSESDSVGCVCANGNITCVDLEGRFPRALLPGTLRGNLEAAGIAVPAPTEVDNAVCNSWAQEGLPPRKLCPTYEQFWMKISGGSSNPRSVYPAEKNVRAAAVALPRSPRPAGGYPYVLYYMYMSRRGIPEGWGYPNEVDWPGGSGDFGFYGGLEENYWQMSNLATRNMQLLLPMVILTPS